MRACHRLVRCARQPPRRRPAVDPAHHPCAAFQLDQRDVVVAGAVAHRRRRIHGACPRRRAPGQPRAAALAAHQRGRKAHGRAVFAMLQRETAVAAAPGGTRRRGRGRRIGCRCAMRHFPCQTGLRFSAKACRALARVVGREDVLGQRRLPRPTFRRLGQSCDSTTTRLLAATDSGPLADDRQRQLARFGQRSAGRRQPVDQAVVHGRARPGTCRRSAPVRARCGRAAGAAAAPARRPWRPGRA